MNRNEFFKRKEVTIVVTDSGLGGLSITADIDRKLVQSKTFKNARIIFFNSLFHNDSGYNEIDSKEQKVEIFNAALTAIRHKYSPDILFIACNSLSVLYKDTAISKSLNFPVIGIVETGVGLIAQHFHRNPDSTVIIFAMEITINANTHKQRLMNLGIDGERIIGQACPSLAGSIERNYNDQRVRDLIHQYVQEALAKVTTSEKSIFISLNCTHFGYSAEIFAEEFAKSGYPDIKIINPNPAMADIFLVTDFAERFPKTEIEVEVVSKTEITDEKIQLLGSLIKPVSQKTADALQHYKFDPQLFDSKFELSSFAK